MAEAAQNWATRLVVLCIGGYQNHLSPRKGWKCAHRVLHGDQSCSQWVKITIAELGCRAALPLVRARFADCKRAARILRAAANEEQTVGKNQTAGEGEESASNPGKRKRKRRNDGCDCYDPTLPCDLFLYWPSGCGRGTIARAGDVACDCGPGDTGCVDCSPCGCIP